MALPMSVTYSNPYLGTLFHYLSYFYFTPFDVLKCGKSKEYILVRYKGRQIISAIIHIFILILHLFRLCGCIHKYIEVRHDISTTFYTVCQISTLIGISNLQHSIWQKQEVLEKYLQMTSLNCSEKVVVKSKMMVSAICLLIIVSSIIQVTVGGQTYIEMESVSSILRTANFPLNKIFNFNIFQVFYDLLARETWIIIKQIISCIGLCVDNLIIILMVVLVLTFKQIINEHFQRCISDSYGDISQFLELYRTMKEIVITGMSVFGSFLLCYYITALSFVAEIPHIIFTRSNELGRVIMITYSIVICSVLAIGSMAHTLIEDALRRYVEFHHWENHWSSNERLKLIAITQDMETEPIALSCCFFAITRKFLSSTFSLVVTYSILVFQMPDREHAFWEENLT